MAAPSRGPPPGRRSYRPFASDADLREDAGEKKDYRNTRSTLFDGIEEGGIRAYSTYTARAIYEDENERALDGLHDRVNILKRLTGDIHEEVESHNRVLDGMGMAMDASRGVLSGTIDRFKTVFESKSNRRMFTLVASLVIIFLIIYYLDQVTRSSKA